MLRVETVLLTMASVSAKYPRLRAVQFETKYCEWHCLSRFISHIFLREFLASFFDSKDLDRNINAGSIWARRAGVLEAPQIHITPASPDLHQSSRAYSEWMDRRDTALGASVPCINDWKHQNNLP